MKYFLTLVLYFLTPILSHSMIKGEKLEGAIIWSGKGQFIIDKGAEDGVAIGEYVQVIQNGRYKSRAVSLRANLDHSLWVEYNIYEPLVLNKSIVLKSSSRHPLIQYMKQKMNLDTPSQKEFVAFVESFKQKNTQRPKEESDLLIEKRLVEKFSEREKSDKINFGYLEDQNPNIKGVSFNINIAPISYKNISGSHEMAYKLSLKQDIPGNHKIDGVLSYVRNSFVQSITPTVISESRYDLLFLYEYGKFNSNFRPFSFMSFESMRENNFYPIRSAFNIGPIGMKYIFDTKEDLLSLAYIPVIDYLNRDMVAVNSLTRRQEIIESSDVNFRHCFLLKAHGKFLKKKMEVTHTAFFRPIQEVDNFSIDFSDVNLRLETEVKYKFHHPFSASYVNLILNDQRIQKSHGFPDTEITHMMTVNYEKRF